MATVDYRPAPGTIPTQPGVYRFRDRHGRVVYVGKATNLRARLSNYFQDLSRLHPRTRAMVTTATQVDWTVVRSEVEALILEHSWINEYDPRFNVVFKDDKSYPYLAVTMNEEFPRMFVTRGTRRNGVRYFGPYARAWAIRQTLDTLLTVTPVRTCTTAAFNRAKRQDRPCLLGYIDKCAAPCVGRISAEDHRELAQRACAVLGGDAKQLVRDLTRQMEQAAANEEFEAAARARDRLRALNNVLERNAIVLAPGTDCDVFALVEGELEVAAYIFRVRDGRIVAERGWIVDNPEAGGRAALMASLIGQVYGADDLEDVPGEVLVPDDPLDVETIEEYLSGLRGARVSVRVPVRGPKSELLDTAGRNAAEVMQQHRLKRAGDIVTRSAALNDLRDALGLAEAPLRIECYDISHTQGTNQMASMVVFEDGVPRKKEYRTFSIPDGKDDLAAMDEVLTRRFTRYLEQAKLPPDEREEGSSFTYPPQLVVVDGGLPQVTAAQAAIDAIGVTDVAVVGLAKRLEELWLPGEEFPVILPRGSEALYLMQRVRDEAHRVAISRHRKRRGKAITASTLDTIPGVGPSRAKALIRHFGSVEQLARSSEEQVALVPGIGDTLAATILAAVRGTGGMLDA